MEGTDELERKLLLFKGEEKEEEEKFFKDETDRRKKSIDFTAFSQIGEIENLFTTIW